MEGGIPDRQVVGTHQFLIPAALPLLFYLDSLTLGRDAPLLLLVLLGFGPVLTGVYDSKIRFFADLAQQYDAGSLRDFVEAKRVFCILSLNHDMRVRTRDQIKKMLLKRIATIHKRAQQKLEAIQLRQRGIVQRIAATLGRVVTIPSLESDDKMAGMKIREYVGSNEKTKALLEECIDVEAKSSTNHHSCSGITSAERGPYFFASSACLNSRPPATIKAFWTLSRSFRQTGTTSAIGCVRT